MTSLPAGVSITPGRDLNDEPTVRLDLEGDLPNGSRQTVSLVAPADQMMELGFRLIEAARPRGLRA